MVDFRKYSRSTLSFFFFPLWSPAHFNFILFNPYVNRPLPRSSVIYPDRQTFTPVVSASSRSSVLHPSRQSFTTIVSPSPRSSVFLHDRQSFTQIVSHSPDRQSITAIVLHPTNAVPNLCCRNTMQFHAHSFHSTTFAIGLT